MTSERIRFLLERYRCKELTGEELDELIELCNGRGAVALEEKIQQELESFYLQHTEAGPGRDIADTDRVNNMLDRVLSVDKTTVQPYDHSKADETLKRGIAPVRRIRKMPSWIRYAAAVVVLAGAGLLSYFLAVHPAPERYVITGKQDRDPLQVRQGPVLTLADGSTLVVDSLREGVVADENGARLVIKDGSLVYDSTGSGSGGMNTMSTPNGRVFSLVLSDGSKVWLNAASTLRYPAVFADQERVVEISGEAYFEVAKNRKIPFRVKVDGKMEVIVHGTSFNVSAYRDESSISTTLIEGSVSIRSQNNTSTALRPGQQGTVREDGTVELNPRANVEQAIAWKNDLFYFADADIKTVMQQLGRWYDMEIVYQGSIPSRRFEGKIERKLSLSDVLESIAKNDIRFQVEGKKIIVYSYPH